jgi:hypothetical protein
MKILVRVLLIIILIYAIFTKSFTFFFDYLNHNPNLNIITNFWEVDLPNIISILAMLYLLVILCNQIGRIIIKG